MTSIGAMLTGAREARGVTLEQAERDTRIIRRYLTALEQEDFGAFPAEVYARGFLKSYSAYLGLNPATLLALLPRNTAPDQALQPRSAPQRNSAARRARQARTATAAPPAGPELLLAAIVGGGLLLAAGVGRLAGSDPAPLFGSPGGSAPSAAQQGTPPAGGAAIAGRMPDLRGMDEAEALRRLAELGVNPFVIEAPSRDVPAGRVIRQSPAPNAAIENATVTVVISRGGGLQPGAATP